MFWFIYTHGFFQPFSGSFPHFFSTAKSVEDLLAKHNRYMGQYQYARLIVRLTKLIQDELAVNPSSPILSSFADDRLRNCLETLERTVSKTSSWNVVNVTRHLALQSRLVPKLLDNQDFVRVLGKGVGNCLSLV